MTKLLIVVLSLLLILSTQFITGHGKLIKDFVKIASSSNKGIDNKITSSSDGETSLDQVNKIKNEIQNTLQKKGDDDGSSKEVETKDETSPNKKGEAHHHSKKSSSHKKDTAHSHHKKGRAHHSNKKSSLNKKDKKDLPEEKTVV
ncbi:hypothetical protein V6N13_070800 [Hibiscus sabdariffa]|uniref:Uncharacterized protein n=1 Tax=Hibiscus sabdariffa TaxID=183260 RepID=A0ABR2TFF1_9ROSI